MDTRRADAHIGGLEHHWHNPDTEILITSVNTNLYWNRVEHLMDDYDRDVASREVMQGMYMPMYGETTTFGLNSEATLAREEHLFTLSAELFGDRKSTRLNSSHVAISYAVFCLKKKKK